MQMRHAWTLALCLVVGSAVADSWVPAKVTARASATGERVIRIIPGTDMGAVFGYAGEPRGRPATAVVYRLHASGNYVKHKEFQLLNPIAPVFYAIADSGELITLDNWHNMGIGGSVVVVYSPDGAVVRSLGLTQLYKPEELAKFRLTVSSLWWRCNSDPELQRDGKTLEILDTLGTSLEIDMKTGEAKRGQAPRTDC